VEARCRVWKFMAEGDKEMGVLMKEVRTGEVRKSLSRMNINP